MASSKLNKFLYNLERDVYRILKPEYPDVDNKYVQSLFVLKREGQYSKAIDGYLNYFNKNYEIYADVLFYFYKTLLAAEEYKAALVVLHIARMWLKCFAEVNKEQKLMIFALDALDHYSRLYDCFKEFGTSKMEKQASSVAGWPYKGIDKDKYIAARSEIVKKLPPKEMSFSQFISEPPLFTTY